MRNSIRLFCLLSLAAGAIGACDASAPPRPRPQTTVAIAPQDVIPAAPAVHKDWSDTKLPFGLRLAAAAEERATHVVRYDAAYLRIPYPMGDVPADQGVCSDEVVRGLSFARHRSAALGA